MWVGYTEGWVLRLSETLRGLKGDTNRFRRWLSRLQDCADWLVSQRVYPTVFIPTTLIGKEGYLSESEIVRLHEAGFNIQSHGVRHKT